MYHYFRNNVRKTIRQFGFGSNAKIITLFKRNIRGGIFHMAKQNTCYLSPLKQGGGATCRLIQSRSDECCPQSQCYQLLYNNVIQKLKFHHKITLLQYFRTTLRRTLRGLVRKALYPMIMSLVVPHIFYGKMSIDTNTCKGNSISSEFRQEPNNIRRATIAHFDTHLNG